ncbi:MAG TPA: CBS domain-containing protein [Kofleriaceae bacterium]|nr:CBS domain-containing protein [Kofleriaceae bacterium]
MKVSGLIRRNVISCTVHDHLERAAQLMWEHDIGCLPVIDEQGHVVGMITDRDICMATYAQGGPLRAIPVAAAMSRHVFSCAENDEVDAVERAMSEHRIRRMPVIDEHGHPVGIVSLGDMARAANLGRLPATDIVSALATISAPRPELVSGA